MIDKKRPEMPTSFPSFGKEEEKKMPEEIKVQEDPKTKKWFSDPLSKLEFVGQKTKYTRDDLKELADSIGCEVPALVAVIRIEAAGSAWNKDGTLKMLYEAHIFGERTQQKFTQSHPTISAKNWAEGKKHYLYGSAEYDRIMIAATLDRKAAFESASWGLGQIMGFNHAIVGYNSAEEMVFKFLQSEREQLNAMVNFMKNTKTKLGTLATAIKAKDWNTFARGYNGASYAQHNYHGKLQNAYVKALSEYNSGGIIIP